MFDFWSSRIRSPALGALRVLAVVARLGVEVPAGADRVVPSGRAAVALGRGDAARGRLGDVPDEERRAGVGRDGRDQSVDEPLDLGFCILVPAAADQADINKLKEQRTALEKVNQSYWAEQVEIQILAAQASLAHAQGNRADALKYMRAAADLEDSTEKHVAMENRLYPMRQLLADLLLEPGHPMAALKEYELSMDATPPAWLVRRGQGGRSSRR